MDTWQAPQPRLCCVHPLISSSCHRQLPHPHCKQGLFITEKNSKTYEVMVFLKRLPPSHSAFSTTLYPCRFFPTLPCLKWFLRIQTENFHAKNSMKSRRSWEETMITQLNRIFIYKFINGFRSQYWIINLCQNGNTVNHKSVPKLPKFFDEVSPPKRGEHFIPTFSELSPDFRGRRWKISVKGSSGEMQEGGNCCRPGYCDTGGAREQMFTDPLPSPQTPLRGGSGRWHIQHPVRPFPFPGNSPSSCSQARFPGTGSLRPSSLPLST